MASNSLLLRFFPLLLFALMAILATALHFNGLYGQDAHEYLRQSMAIFEYWNTGASMVHTLGDTEFSSGYPATGALLRYIISDPILALQVVSWLSFALSAWLLERIVAMLSHGSRADSRLIFTLVTFAMAPVAVRAGLVIMSDSLGMVLTLAAFFFGLRWVERARGMDTVFAAVCIALAVSVRIGLAGLLAPLTLVIVGYLITRNRLRWLVFSGLAGFAILLPHCWIDHDVLVQPFEHSELHWSLLHFFQRSFQYENGLATYLFPNLLYLAFPLMHPGFCLTLPGLLFLFKKTDIHLPAKKTILLCLGGYFLLLGGLPLQNLRFLLPAYGLFLLLLFPAWDRLYCYGLYFFKRLTHSLLGITLLLQLVFCVRMIAPTVSRNHLEQSIAKDIKPLIPANAIVYGFDLDISLHSYLPDIRFINLWVQRYTDFPIGGFVLFNEPGLHQQWDGQNPMLNWNFLQENYTLEVVKNLPEGWVLYTIGAREKAQ